MTNILGLKQNRWIVGAVLLLTTCNLQAQEQPNAREKFEKGNWFVSGALNGEWLTKTIGNVYAGGKISGGVYLTPLSGFRATAEIGKNRIGNDTEATQLSANLDYMLTLIGNNPVGLRREHGPAHGAAFHLVPALADLGVQGRVQREDGGPKPPA